MKMTEIQNVIEAMSPLDLQEQWDNSGFQIILSDDEVNKVLVAMEVTQAVADEAVRCNADLIITHHPLIFKGLKKVNSEDFIGRRIIELIKHDIAYYAMHTNFDIAVMADLASEKLGLKETSVLQPTGSSAAGDVGIGKAGRFPKELSLKECIDVVKRTFAIDTVKVFAPVSFTGSWESFFISKAAVCPGSGKSVIGDALKAKAQVLITGDIDHHEGIDAAAQGMAVLDAGHYGLEKMFIPYMKEQIESQLSGVEVIAQKVKRPFLYV